MTSPDVTLMVEGETPIDSPPPSRLREAVEGMSLPGGSGCIIIEGGGRYAVAAGGSGRYTAEWHEPTLDGFRHWVAGRPGEPGGVVIVRAGAFDISVQATECLTGPEVLAILEAFRRGECRPARFTWRDVTDGFF